MSERGDSPYARDRIAQLYYRKLFPEETQDRARRRVDWMAAQAYGSRVLDIGCSEAILAILLAREGFDVVAIDINPEAITYAQSLISREIPSVAQRIRLQTIDIASAKLEGEFDTVMAGEVLEHLNHPERILEAAHGYLSDGGRFVMTTPFGYFPHEDHRRSFRPSEIAQMAQPLFTPQHLSVIDGYIRFVGIKSAAAAIDQDLYASNMLLAVSEAAALEAQRELHAHLESAREQIGNLKSVIEEHKQRFAERNEVLVQIGRLEAAIAGRAALEPPINRGSSSGHLLSDDEGGSQKAVLTERARARIDLLLCGIERDRLAMRLAAAGLFAREQLRMSTAPGASTASDVEQPVPGAVEVDQFAAIFADLRRDPFIAGESDMRRPVAVILDDFSDVAFAPEILPLRIAPATWLHALTARRPDYCLVESAWRGNGDLWSDKISNNKNSRDVELKELLKYCRNQKIPTIFWNKEDPVHFQRFIRTAAAFDHVFTTDANVIPLYQMELGRTDRIDVLPFAVQPKVHNPIISRPRDRSVCFAGTFHKQRYTERRSAIDNLLAPALSHGLVIYDRTFGRREYSTEDYGFPEPYAAAVRGQLDYAQMISVYKAHRVFLNVNSVSDSPTMFSRRVLELLACGTPVISSYSKGIEALLGDAVQFSNSAEETAKLIESLADDEVWARRAVRGIRVVMETHKVSDRLSKIEAAAGRGHERAPEPVFIVLSRWRTAEHLANLAQILKGQSHRSLRLVLIGTRAPPIEMRRELAAAIGRRQIVQLNPSNSAQRSAFIRAVAPLDAWLAIIDPRNAYGPDYLGDYVHAMSYFPGHVLGRSTFVIENADGSLGVKNPGHEFVVGRSVHPNTVAIRAMTVTEPTLMNCLNDRWFKSGLDALALHRFGFVDRRGSQRQATAELETVLTV